ncbi:MAG TPA: methyltransferase domain-containing protein [Alphaproteobacteria bacterium]|nr:methyltransferase domain-containing protein [Alphaproteobacteria bacterium]
MTEESPLESWTAGEPYERYMGRWSRKVAARFLPWLGVGAEARWGDVGCGTGTLIETILQQHDPASVAGLDRSAGYVAHARTRLQGPRVRLAIGDATALPWKDYVFDATVCGLLLNFLPDADLAIREMARVTTPGGKVAAYVWDYSGGMEMMRHFWDAAVALRSETAALDQGERFPLCQPEALKALLMQAGLQAVEVCGIDIETPFRNFDEYWQPFLGGQGAAPSYVVALQEHARRQLREALRQRLPVAADGSIQLHARAWAVKGTSLGGQARKEGVRSPLTTPA